MKKALILILLLSSVSAMASVIVISDGIWMVSSMAGTNDFLAGKLYDIEVAAKEGKHASACSLCRKLKKDTEGQNLTLNDGEPLPIVLDSMELFYQTRMKKEDEAIADEARELLKQYSSQAEGQGYSAYKYLFHRIRGYCFQKKDYKGMIEAQKDMILYDPCDYGQIMALMDYANKYSEECGSLVEFGEKFEKCGGVIDPEFALSIMLSSSERQEKKLEKCCLWLLKNRLGDSYMLTRAFPRISSIASSKNRKGLVEYYLVLTDVALQQPASDDRMAVFAAALNEKQKLEAAAPDILPPKITNKD